MYSRESKVDQECASIRGKLGSLDLSEGKRANESDDDLESETRWVNISMKNIEIGEQIGGGGFAVVYQGYWNNKKVALKTLFDPRVDEGLKQEFMDELFIMSQIDHPNVVKLFGGCVKPPDLCMVMELCENSLFNVLHQERQQFSEKEIVSMGIQVASALEYLHTQNPAIIHRDVKSHNVLVTNDMQLKLCDFGLVGTDITTAGTPAYMAPELLSNKCFSKKVDIYAFAVLLWEMFTASIPFASWDSQDIRDFILNGKRLRLPQSGCPKQCCALIDRCWSADAERRPEFSQIHRALTRIKTTLRDVSHVEETCEHGGDSFDALSSSFSKKK